MKEELLTNYEEHLYFKKYNKLNNVILPGQEHENLAEYEKIHSVQRFWAICNVKTSEPYWSAHSESLTEAITVGMMQTLPHSFKNMVVNKPTLPYIGDNISGEFIPYNDSLPHFKSKDPKTGVVSPKSYKVPANLYIKQIINFIYTDLEVNKTILARENEEATQHLALLL